MDGLLVGIFETLASNVIELSKCPVIGNDQIIKYRTLKTFEIFTNLAAGHIFTTIKVTSYLIITYEAVKVLMSVGSTDGDALTQFMVSIALLVPSTMRMQAFLSGMAFFYIKSVGLLEDWKASIRLQSKDRGLNVRYLRSFNPLQFSINSMYGMKGDSVLSFFSALLQNISSVLIAYREEEKA